RSSAWWPHARPQPLSSARARRPRSGRAPSLPSLQSVRPFPATPSRTCEASSSSCSVLSCREAAHCSLHSSDARAERGGTAETVLISFLSVPHHRAPGFHVVAQSTPRSRRSIPGGRHNNGAVHRRKGGGQMNRKGSLITGVALAVMLGTGLTAAVPGV